MVEIAIHIDLAFSGLFKNTVLRRINKIGTRKIDSSRSGDGFEKIGNTPTRSRSSVAKCYCETRNYNNKN